MNKLLHISTGVRTAIAVLCAGVAVTAVAGPPVPRLVLVAPPDEPDVFDRQRFMADLHARIFPCDPFARPASATDPEPAGDVIRAIGLLKTADPPASPNPLPVSPADRIPDVPPPSTVDQAGCKSCGTGMPGSTSGLDLLTSDPGECYPGRYNTAAGGMPNHAFGRFAYGVYECLCVPDPCYEPKWTPLADTAFFTPAARPVSQTRFRGRLTRGLGTPDRAEWFWPRGIGSDRGPRDPGGRRVRFVDDDELSMYTEAASGKFSFYTVLPYHRVRPDANGGASGFGNLTLGTKTLLHDCELFQVAFQMETILPTANSTKGLGNGHLTLEPSVILGLKLSHDLFLQAQVAQWIPIGGDPGFAGSALRYNFAVNKILCRPLPDCPLIGTFEFTGITFQDGAFTDPVTGNAVRGSGISYISIGPGLRQFICDRVDFGIGSVYGIGDAAGPRQEYRIDLRVRY